MDGCAQGGGVWTLRSYKPPSDRFCTISHGSYRSFIRQVTTWKMCIGQTGHTETDQFQIAKHIRLIVAQSSEGYIRASSMPAMYTSTTLFRKITSDLGRKCHDESTEHMAVFRFLLSPPCTSMNPERGNTKTIAHTSAGTYVSSTRTTTTIPHHYCHC